MKAFKFNYAASSCPPVATPPTAADIERRALLAAQIAFTATRLGLDIFEMNACVRLGIVYLEHQYSAASAYERAIKTAVRVAQMNQLVELWRRSHAPL